MKSIPGIVMVKVTHVIGAGEKLATFSHYWQEVSNIMPAGPGMLSIANYFHSTVGALWKVFSSAQYKMWSTKTFAVNGVLEADGVSNAAEIAGLEEVGLTTNNASLGAEIAAVLQRRTGKPGRRYRGRMFVPGIAETFNKNGYINNDAGSEFDDLAAVLGTNHTVNNDDEGTFTLAARHYTPEQKDGEGIVTAPPAFEVITDVRVLNRLSTRKDRVLRGNIFAR